ncbi:hypothetical protein Z517_11419 [Fonsecaea pedrosoi CBS 271.37]|uniref:Uncharacterized protein n=1 Tax=Fonsecaea pedrosoi CBS 271.37 TaxID=1442368 RepID=A0A0D2GQF6_9EURO|nr:uncharacterized protein Z517_11419 [Fonsecaea pedrosoi CBS 271.37]KIW74649.1 hypothetical protein Z517_11419 [Fonsecaea pedrosoi CBS 271.37]
MSPLDNAVTLRYLYSKVLFRLKNTMNPAMLLISTIITAAITIPTALFFTNKFGNLANPGAPVAYT